MKYISFLLLVVSFLTSKNTGAQNLVKNGSAESFDGTTNAPSDWTIIYGKWKSIVASSSSVDPVKNGTYCFFPGVDSAAILQQDIDVSTSSNAIDKLEKTVLFLGYVQSFDQGSGFTDLARITVQCLNADKSAVLHTFDSDTIASIGIWKAVHTSFGVPKNTRHIRIQLIAKRRAGLDNDAYFDDIHLVMNTTGIDNTNQTRRTKVYPTLVSNELIIEQAAGSSFMIYNTAGMVVRKGMLLTDKEKISTTDLPAGVYITVIQDIATHAREVARIQKY